jgi:hypothetical protein
LTVSVIKGEDSETPIERELTQVSGHGEIALLPRKAGSELQYKYESKVGVKSIVGTFSAKIEEKPHRYDASSKVIKDQNMVFRVKQFPKFTEEGKHTPDELAKLQAEKIEFAMSFASEYLSKLNAPPSEAHPIVLRGEDPEQLRYLWTAFVYLGKNNPNLKFDERVINVYSRSFDPKNEKSFLGKLFGKFKNDSLYETAFKSNPELIPMRQQCETISTIKQDQKDYPDLIHTKMLEISKFYKSAVGEVSMKGKKSESNDALRPDTGNVSVTTNNN